MAKKYTSLFDSPVDTKGTDYILANEKRDVHERFTVDLIAHEEEAASSRTNRK